MLDLLRRHVVILTSLAMGWSAYTFYNAGDAKPEALAKGSMTDIAPEFLAVRDTSIPFTIANDPYRLDAVLELAGHPAAEPGAASGKPAAHGASAAAGGAHGAAGRPLSQADLVAAFTGALRAVAHETHELFAGPAPSGAPDGSLAGPGAAGRPAPRGFTMLLQSTLDMAGNGQARINGRTVAEGETMPFLDPLDPPLLRRVQGTAVLVTYDGQNYVADLLDSPLLQVGQPLVAAAAASAPAAPKPSATSGQSAAPATSPVPGTNASKPKGTYRVRGKSSKKP